MQLHPRIPWWEYLRQWREVEGFYVQVTVAQGQRGLAARSRTRISIIDELLKSAGDAVVPDCNLWDKEFKAWLTGIAMSDPSEHKTLIAELGRLATSGHITKIYGRRRVKRKITVC